MLDAAYAAYDQYAEVKTNEALCACAHTYKYTNIDKSNCKWSLISADCSEKEWVNLS